MKGTVDSMIKMITIIALAILIFFLFCVLKVSSWCSQIEEMENDIDNF